MAKAIQRVDPATAAQATGLQVDKAHQFVTKFGDNYYVNKDGRRYKMDERFGPGQYQVEVGPVSEAEYKSLTRMMGSEGPCIIMKSIITVAGQKMAEEYGYATPGNCPAGADQFKKQGLHIAVTRAINRAMGLLTAGGFGDSTHAYNGPQRGYIPTTDSGQAAFLQNCQRLKKALNEKTGSDHVYYEVVNGHGYKKTNDQELCTNAMAMERVLADLESALSGGATTEGGTDADFEEIPEFLDNPDYYYSLLRMADQEDMVNMASDLMGSICEHEAMKEKHKSGKTYAALFHTSMTKLLQADEIDVEKVVEAFSKAAGIMTTEDA